MTATSLALIFLLTSSLPLSLFHSLRRPLHLGQTSNIACLYLFSIHYGFTSVAILHSRHATITLFTGSLCSLPPAFSNRFTPERERRQKNSEEKERKIGASEGFLDHTLASILINVLLSFDTVASSCPIYPLFRFGLLEVYPLVCNDLTPQYDDS